MYAIQHRCMSLKVDVSRTKLIYVIFEFVLLHITIINLTKHRCIHVRNFVRKKPPYISLSPYPSQRLRDFCYLMRLYFAKRATTMSPQSLIKLICSLTHHQESSGTPQT